jgi:uncharacterized membrane protein YccC
MEQPGREGNGTRQTNIQERLQFEEDRLHKIQQLRESKEIIAKTQRELDILKGSPSNTNQSVEELSEKKKIRRQIIEKVNFVCCER